MAQSQRHLRSVKKKISESGASNVKGDMICQAQEIDVPFENIIDNKENSNTFEEVKKND
ncbi:hypothetical protein [Flavobacterium lipolyticum]|uniref:Uncharacterized protein n=1 Tax=Flavobacterium lipolyticum TaxID=2893754 RepID=A0ABS8LWQ3_9FLAO|nr:hypothetical protein [Flavobacterium sp. F-126]MCC9016416.1 hypothetical protein [Flavobacterium sp. F-126]